MYDTPMKILITISSARRNAKDSFLNILFFFNFFAYLFKHDLNEKIGTKKRSMHVA